MPWSKENELNYVKGLIDGSVWDKNYHQPKISVKAILLNYIKSAKKRMEWGTYVRDGDEVIKYAETKYRTLSL